MKSNIKIPSGLLYRFLLIVICLLPVMASAQIIMETKGDDTPIRVFGKETIKVFGGLKHSQVDNSDPKKAKLNFIKEGSRLILTDTLYNASGNPIFLKTFDGQDSSKVIFQSLANNKNYILGDSINFYQAAIDLADYDHEVILGEHIFLRDTLTMQLGNINLNGKKLFLIPEESDNFSLLNQRQPYIINEYYESYIWDTLSGSINLDICVPQNEINNTPYNFGGMGIELQNTNNSLNGDVVQLKRTHNLYAIDTFESITRQYHIDNVDDTDIFNQTFNYLYHEITSENFNNVENLVLYRSRDNGINWDLQYRDSSDFEFVTKNDLDSLQGIWSLSPCPNPPSTATLPDTVIVTCALDTVWLNAGSNVSVLWNDGSTQNPYPFVPPNNFDIEIDYFDDLAVEITDDRGCYSYWFGNAEIHHSPPTELIFASQYTDCEDVNGTETITAEMNELFGYDYQWHDGSTNQTFQYPLSPIGDSTYWVTATYIGSQLTCSSTDSIDVSIYPSAAVELPDTLALSCDGTSIILDAGTYVPGATYEWFTSDDPSIPIAGADSSVYAVPPFIGEDNYVVTVSFDGFCFAFASQDVAMTNIQVNANHTDIDCFGANNGLITTNISGSYPDHITYFDGVDTDGVETFPNLGPGTYVLEVEDDFCSVIDSIEITEPIAPLSGTLTATDIACASLGQIDFAPAGGTQPYTFLWNNGETSEDLTNLTQGGDYTVTLTDFNSCTFVQTTTVNNFGALTTALDTTEISCFGQSDGQLVVEILSGTPPFTYNWNNAATTDTISNLGPAFYAVTVTDNNNCTSVQSYDLQDPAEVVADYQQQNILCAGETNGSLTAQNLGGTGPFTFAWSTGATSQNLDNLSAGDYDVTITDNNNCTAIGNFSITEPTTLAGTISSSDIDCNNPGQLNLTPSGGNTPYTFLWSNAATTEDQNVSMAGIYSVTITDANGCTSTASAEIFNNGDLAVSESNIQNISCNGELDGAFTLDATGGVTPYTYDIGNGGVNTPTFTDLAAGTYNATITDANGCIGNLEITLDEPLAIEINITSTNADCGQTNGTASTTASGGTGALSYQWPDGNTNPNISNLAAGSYILTITDATGCTNTATATIGNNDGPILDGNPIITNVTCNGDNTGAITVTSTGGTGTLTYSWSTGDNGTTVNNISAGDYIVTVSDDNNCQDINTITITEPTAIVANPTVQNIDCNSSGQISFSPSGGNMPYTFLWNNNETTEDLTVTIAGIYSVTITDALGCTNTASEEVLNTGNLIVTESNVQNISCNGDSDGAFTADVTGGIAPYTYDIGNGPVNTSTFTGLATGAYNITVTDVNNCVGNLAITLDEPIAIEINITSMDAGCGQSNGSAMTTASGGTGALSYLWPDASTNPNIANLAAGSYIVTVTDATGCTNTATASIGNSNGPALDANPIITNINCNGDNTGAITVSATGGTGALTYTWNTGAVGASINNLIAGDYTVTVSDVNNCQDNTSITITQAEAISPNTTVQNIDCDNPTGTATANPSGGTGVYTYQWNTGSSDMSITNLTEGFYSVTVTDANNCSNTETVEITSNGTGISVSNTTTPIDCNGAITGSITLTVNTGGSYIVNWNTGQIGETIDNLAAGNYVATVTSGPCMEIVDISLDEPDAIDIQSMVNNISCSGTDNGSIDLTISGGTGAYTFIWDNGETTEDLSNLSAGDYMVTVMDANNCTETASFTIGSSSDLNVNVTGMDLSCFELNDGTATANTFGGLPPFMYSWSNGGTTETISDLPIGTYEVTVTDASGCEGISSVILTQPAVINFSFSFSELNCFGDTDGAITVSSDGGPQPIHLYNWSTGQVGATISNLAGGDYTVTITSGSCSQPEVVTLNEPDQIFAEYSATDVNCFGGDDGAIDLTVFGGIAPLTYSWDNGATTEDLSNLTAAFYNLTITDNNGCTGEQMTLVDEPDQIAILENTQLAGCKTENDGWINLNVTGGVPDYLFAWSNGSSTQVINNLSGGNYAVTVTDQNDCTVERSFELEESPEPFEAYYLAATPVNYGDTIQFVDVSYPKPNSWNWSFDDPDNSTATEANPEFFYPQDLNNEISYYDVELIASTDFCTDTIVKEITVHNFRNDAPEVDTTIVNGKYFEYFKVYPNPTNGLVMLDMKLKQSGDVKLYLMDTSGKRIRKYKLEGSDVYFQNFDLGQLAGGVYILTAKFKKDRRSVKLIVVDER